MNTFFGLEFSGGPFVLLSFQHWVAIILIIAAGIWMVVSQRKASETSRKIVRYTMAGILIVNESLWHLWNLVTGQWTIQTMLPFHLCSALVWACAYMLITKDKRIYPFAYLIGIAGALQAILTPDLGQYAFPHFRYFQVFLSHGTIILSAVYMTLVEGYRPTMQSIKQVAIYGNLYLVFVFILNQLIGSNYLFIAHKPETASLLDVLPPWPYYILIIELLAAAFIFIFYAPFAIKDWREKRITAKAAKA